ncbi:uncharacterized protein LTR77_001399 [Saxophila tyrrhenica]|uniref:Uncharacterized protein n=1 Tax=Saxophila tyrrhenica TaxID=1690608 RepID=A0AAV9PPV7_9PEZI|nr:hypothetical protein LTR77_001399 [Saxophila tyrrhenica]
MAQPRFGGTVTFGGSPLVVPIATQAAAPFAMRESPHEQSDGTSKKRKRYSAIKSMRKGQHEVSSNEANGTEDEECESKKAPIGLLDLPVELWRQIVDEAIEEKEMRILHKLDTKRIAAEVAQPGILRVCRVIREEYLPLYYKRTTFVAESYIHKRQELCQWLTAIGPSNRLYMKNLYVRDSGSQLKRHIWRVLRGEDQEDRTIVAAMEVVLHDKAYAHVTFTWRARSNAEEGLPARWYGREQREQRRLLEVMPMFPEAEAEDGGLVPVGGSRRSGAFALQTM